LSLPGKAGITFDVINRDRPVPPYLQLAAIIRGQAESGELAPGTRLPSIVDLAAQYDIAVPTVRKAIEVLKREGVVVTHQGYGTFISEDAGGSPPPGT
jgi:GntR family transcriptional regulator